MDFIQQMLGLRKQRLEEEEAKQKERLAQQAQMMDTIGDIQEGIGSAFKTGQENQMANQLMCETYGQPPRAQAVDPSMQGPADLAAQRMPGFYTGGMPELKMRMGMEEFQSKDLARRADIYSKTRNLEFQQDKWRVQQAQTAKKDIDKNLDQDVKNENWYLKENRVVDSAIEKAQTPEQWRTAVDHKIAVNNAAQKRGMKVEPFDPTTIAPFMSQTEKDALTTQQDAVSQARTDLEDAKKAPLGWADTLGLRNIAAGALGMEPGPTYHEEGVTSAQQLYEQEQQKLRETPGASFYGEKPVTSSAPAKKNGELRESGGPAVGDTKMLRNKATKRVEEFVWDGTAWVPR